MPENVKDPAEHAYRLAGGTHDWPKIHEGFRLHERMIPTFEEKLVERLPTSQIVQDWKGNICEIGLEFDTNYLRDAIDFVTRKWIKCPVETRDDWEQMKERYDANDPSRYPADPTSAAAKLEGRERLMVWHFSGPFWQLREWLGFENLCMLFHDDPKWLSEMIQFWEEHVARLIENGLKHVVPDMLHLSEDMAYKVHPMISPEATREFLLPTYKRWGNLVRDKGCKLYGMDSDGYIADLIPVWIDAGINVCDPMEVAAGNDLIAFRTRFGKKMAYMGGVDKRAIAAGGQTIVDEINRLRPLIEEGGFIPSCDHGIPSDVSWADFVRYVKLLAEATGWL